MGFRHVIRASCAILTLVLVSAACVSKYVAPSDGDTATLTVINETRGQIQSFTFREAATCKHRYRMDPLLEPGATGTFTLRAGAEVSLWEFWFQGNTYCSMIFSFDPKASHRYLLRIDEAPGACGLRLIDTTDPSATVRVPIVRRKQADVIWDESSSFCDAVR
jgi:hypothetical protein